MNDEQEALIRFIFSQMRKIRVELDHLYGRKKKLENLTDNLYITGLDSLWIKGNTQLLELYNIIIERYGAIKDLEHQLLTVILDSSNSVNPLNSKE